MECLEDWRMYRHQELCLFSLPMSRQRGKRTTVYKYRCGEYNCGRGIFSLQTKLNKGSVVRYRCQTHSG